MQKLASNIQSLHIQKPFDTSNAKVSVRHRRRGLAHDPENVAVEAVGLFK